MTVLPINELVARMFEHRGYVKEAGTIRMLEISIYDRWESKNPRSPSFFTDFGMRRHGDRSYLNKRFKKGEDAVKRTAKGEIRFVTGLMKKHSKKKQSDLQYRIDKHLGGRCNPGEQYQEGYTAHAPES